MPSRRNNVAGRPRVDSDEALLSADEVLLDAARATILAVGRRRSTLTDVARQAGVSRMTLYRRWPDMTALVADLMTREWCALAEASRSTVLAADCGRRRVAAEVTATVAALRENVLFAKIVEVDPELLLPYLLVRRGRTHDALLGSLVTALVAGQEEGSVRAGDPVLLARSVLLAAQSFALSAGTMTGPDGPTTEDLDGELGRLVESYLAPLADPVGEHR
jgi:AcrR family transcriptional regulator